MRLAEMVRQIKDHTYTYEGEEYQVAFEEAYSKEDVEEWKESLPVNYLPKEVEELLQETPVIYSSLIGEINFDYNFVSSSAAVAKHYIELSKIEEETAYILLINPETGEWEDVWIYSKEKCFLYKWCNSLSSFLQQKVKSQLSNVENEHLIWKVVSKKVRNRSFIDVNEAKVNGDEVIRDVAKELEEGVAICDLRNCGIMEGFSWISMEKGTYIDSHPTERIWTIHPPKREKTFFQRLFGI